MQCDNEFNNPLGLAGIGTGNHYPECQSANGGPWSPRDGTKKCRYDQFLNPVSNENEVFMKKNCVKNGNTASAHLVN